jgi:hypothetical protein
LIRGTALPLWLVVPEKSPKSYAHLDNALRRRGVPFLIRSRCTVSRMPKIDLDNAERAALAQLVREHLRTTRNLLALVGTR